MRRLQRHVGRLIIALLVLSACGPNETFIPSPDASMEVDAGRPFDEPNKVADGDVDVLVAPVTFEVCDPSWCDKAYNVQELEEVHFQSGPDVYSTHDHLQESTGNTLAVVGDVARSAIGGWIVLPGGVGDYCNEIADLTDYLNMGADCSKPRDCSAVPEDEECDSEEDPIAGAAFLELKRLGYNVEDYDVIVMIIDGFFRTGETGVFRGHSVSWMRARNQHLGVLSHEAIGHGVDWEVQDADGNTFRGSLNHAGSLENDVVNGGACDTMPQDLENLHSNGCMPASFGDQFDPMGSGKPVRYSAYQLEVMCHTNEQGIEPVCIIDELNIAVIDTAGTTRITLNSISDADPTQPGTYMARIPNIHPNERFSYIAEFRHPAGKYEGLPSPPVERPSPWVDYGGISKSSLVVRLAIAPFLSSGLVGPMTFTIPERFLTLELPNRDTFVDSDRNVRIQIVSVDGNQMVVEITREEPVPSRGAARLPYDDWDDGVDSTN